ncbi:MAG: prepilin-type N-terminal cleavage/methylation domain-containing protein [Thermosipho sp. (in: Bacteria)]|nr:prepilin-type N-terminal cleavage/methylation domain-containing protein [Thermosipho sp. (in: thermotogales)]
MVKNVKSGFSLIEVLVVLTIIAIISGIAYGMYSGIYVALSNRSKLTNSIQRVFYIFVSARREAFLKNNILCIKYEDKKFSYFTDNDLDGISDNGNEVVTEIADDVTVLFDNKNINSIKIYTFDGMFLKYSNNSFSFDYSNMEIKFQLNKEYQILKITNSLPEILE